MGFFRQRVRPFFRAGGVILSVLVSLLVLAVMWVLLFWNQPARRTIQQATTRTWARVVLWLLNGKVIVKGTPPEGGALVVSNHLSYIDIPVIAHVLPPRFVAKIEISKWPALGLACKMIETIFVDRSKRRDTVRVGKLIEEGLARGDNVVLFPEGTSGPGHDLLPFKPPLLAPVAQAEIPVHYAAVSFKTFPPDRPAFLSIAWWADTDFQAHCPGLLQLDRWEATLTFGSEPIVNSDRKQLAIELREAIRELFEPMVDYEPLSPDNPIPKHPVDADSSGSSQSSTPPPTKSVE